MIRWNAFRGSEATSILAAVMLSLSLLGAIVGARRMLSESNGQARALVAEGQAELAKGDRAHAALSLARARLVAPRAEVVRSALAAANMQDDGSLSLRVIHWVSPREWSLLAISAGWVAGLCVAIVIARRRAGLVARAALGAGIAFVLGMGGVMESNMLSLAVITKPDVGLLVAPYSGCGAIGPVRTGSVVHIGTSYEAFVKVKARDGAEGWVPRDTLEQVAGMGS